ncbi:MAG: sulfotransferase family protein [Actinomycetota bacterium]
MSFADRPSPSPGGEPRELGGKVFGLGLARTGTTSMHEAMLVLGLRSAPDSIPLLDGVDLDFLRRYDAFFDNPIPFRYRALDAICPDSRYIVTHRERDSWLASMEWLFGAGLDRLDPKMRAVGDRVHRQVYGSDRFDADRLRAVYDRHEREVREFVADRPHVWLDVEDGFRWEPICALLGLAIPSVDFPRVNARGRRKRGRLRRG